jgi:restriction system protein
MRCSFVIGRTKVEAKCGELIVHYTSTGLPRFQLEISHPGLHKYQVVRGDNQYIVEQKASAQIARWNEEWRKRESRERKANSVQERKEEAERMSNEAQDVLDSLERILAHTLSVNDAIDWELLKRGEYSVAKPQPTEVPGEPLDSDFRYEPALSLFDLLLPFRRKAKRARARKKYEDDHNRWMEAKAECESRYAVQLQKWYSARDTYNSARDATNAAIDAQRDAYLKGNSPQAILDYCDLVLSRSEYPDYFPQSYELDYSVETKVLIIDYQLPPVGAIPTLKEVKYVQSRDELVEKYIMQSHLNKLYDSVLYQVALRTIHELYEADQVDAIASVVFNGYVEAVDPGTGVEHNSCVLSLQAGKEEFTRVNLSRVDPKACFKGLKGIAASRLHTITPVAPVLEMNRKDNRFVQPYGVAEKVDGENLAAMDWEDFEHLIRELFEKEFASHGGEVKITRASRDGGVDAVVFDPDPIRGGKIVIQAKRYTNTVGVSAVRDLYGTLINEGANKGILVTTADYGPDAYEFARSKPIVLLGGGQLLHLLEKHGHKARIDLKEAKLTLADDKFA